LHSIFPQEDLLKKSADGIVKKTKIWIKEMKIMNVLKKMQQKREEERRRQKLATAKKIGIAFSVGAVLAATAALFTAPKSGKELRQDVADKVESSAELVKEKKEVLAEKISATKESSANIAKAALDFSQSFKDRILKAVGYSSAATCCQSTDVDSEGEASADQQSEADDASRTIEITDETSTAKE
jgi:gas vesicle protein